MRETITTLGVALEISQGCLREGRVTTAERNPPGLKGNFWAGSQA